MMAVSNDDLLAVLREIRDRLPEPKADPKGLRMIPRTGKTKDRVCTVLRTYDGKQGDRMARVRYEDNGTEGIESMRFLEPAPQP